MDADPANERPHHEGLVARAGRRGGARRQGLGHGQRRQHRRHDGLGPAAHGPHQGRLPPGHRHADPGARARAPDGPARRRRQRRVPARVARAVRPDGRRVRPRAATASRRPGSACSPSARSRPRATRWSRRPTRCWPSGALDRRAGATFVGNVEGRDLMTDDVDVVVTDGFTGNVVLKTLEGGLKSHRRRHLRGLRLAPTRPGRPPSVLLPALLPLYEHARPRQHRRRHAPRASTASASSATARRRPRPIVNAVRVAAEMVEADLVGGLTAAIRPPE